MKVSDNGSGNFEQLEPGVYAATCTKIIDLGTQEGEYQGTKTRNRKVLLGFQVAYYMSDGRPFYVMGVYSASISEKATLRKLLEGWRGKPFTPEELSGFDLKKVLGKHCQLVIGLSQTGKSKITTAVPLKDAVPPSDVSEIAYLSLEPEEYNDTTFEAQGEWVKKQIISSPEWQKAKHALMAKGGEGISSADIPF
jgi:hypothetical protein